MTVVARPGGEGVSRIDDAAEARFRRRRQALPEGGKLAAPCISPGLTQQAVIMVTRLSRRTSRPNGDDRSGRKRGKADPTHRFSFSLKVKLTQLHERLNVPPALLMPGSRRFLAIFSQAMNDVGTAISAQDLRSIGLEATFELRDLLGTLLIRRHRGFPEPQHLHW
jgi:hypothetical protein